jgi:hypothetical protein
VHRVPPKSKHSHIEYIGVVSVYFQYNCVYYFDTCPDVTYLQEFIEFIEFTEYPPKASIRVGRVVLASGPMVVSDRLHNNRRR